MYKYFIYVYKTHLLNKQASINQRAITYICL